MEGMVILSDFWKNKKVLVTGHTGFKGSWLSIYLKKLGAEVLGYSLLPPSTPNMFSVCQLNEKVKSHIGDIRNLAELNDTLKTFQPEIVFHLAAQSLVLKSYKEPLETYSTNVMGTVHLLEVARKLTSVKVIINVTSDKCYEDKGQIAYKESDALGGHDPYSSSKACAELVSTAYRQSFSIPLSTVRAGNIIGGGDWAESRLIPDCIRSLAENKPIVIRNPKAVRPWQHVLEPICGYLQLAEKMWAAPKDLAGSWNFGPEADSFKPVEAIVDEMIQLWGKGSFTLEPSSQHETQILKLDSAKAKTALEWKPRWTLQQSLANLVDWYQRFYKNEDMYQVTLKQIEDYEKLF